MLADSAWDGLSQDLAARLTFALGPTLRLERRAAKAVARSCGNARRGVQNPLLETIDAFPGVLETAAHLIASWIDAQRELLDRLLQDKQFLRASFLGGRKACRIIAIRPGLSDPHEGGRTVTMIAFTGNHRVIYKPRSSDAEALWFGALGWLERNGIRTVFRVPQITSRKNYSWMEFIESKSCRSLNAVRLFYFRWGAQAALAQLLGASDLHRENWIAAGAQPILVDAERIKSGIKDRQSLPSLLETGLLPLTARDRAGFYQGVAPLDPILSEAMATGCWPQCNRMLHAPRRYVDDLVRGFDGVVKIFANSEAAKVFFAEIASPMTKRTNVRVLFRASAQYARLLRQSLEPVNMFSRNERNRWLVRECAASAANRTIGLAEAQALLRVDLPKFTARKKIARASWKRFSRAAAGLKGSSTILRRRVRLGKRSRG